MTAMARADSLDRTAMTGPQQMAQSAQERESEVEVIEYGHGRMRVLPVSYWLPGRNILLQAIWKAVHVLYLAYGLMLFRPSVISQGYPNTGV
jgi:hypothetical protein